MTTPYENDETDLGITHAYGEDTVLDVVSTYPGIDSLNGGEGIYGDGQPKVVVVRKPRP
jgi:hypothetical protein